MSNSKVEYASPTAQRNHIIKASPQQQSSDFSRANNSLQPFPIGINNLQQQNSNFYNPQQISMIRQQQQGMQGHQSPKNLLFAPQGNNFKGNNFVLQAQTPTSSIISSTTNSPRNFPPCNNTNLNYYNQNFQYPQQQQKTSIINNRDIKSISFYKGSGSLGIRVVGGNQGGIFVSMIQEDSPAAQNGIR